VVKTYTAPVFQGPRRLGQKEKAGEGLHRRGKISRAEDDVAPRYLLDRYSREVQRDPLAGVSFVHIPPVYLYVS